MDFIVMRSSYTGDERLVTNGMRRCDMTDQDIEVYHKKKAIVDKRAESWSRNLIYYIGSLVTVTKDFELNPANSAAIQIVEETDSIQIRPKAIYLSKKGTYYYRMSNKRVYLTDKETDELKGFINQLNS